MENIAYVIFGADITRFLQYFNNISDRFRNILAVLQYFQGIFLQYCINISVLCGIWYAEKWSPEKRSPAKMVPRKMVPGKMIPEKNGSWINGPREKWSPEK